MADIPGRARIGEAVRRKEDLRLLTGAGSFSDDISLPRQAWAVMLRSPHAHARIASIDSGEARAQPGVLAVLTGQDLLADGLKPIPHVPASVSPPDIPIENRDGSAKLTSRHFPLPATRVRFVGEAVAVIIAETQGQARDAAEKVIVEYQPLPAVCRADEASQPGAPRVCEEAPSNICVDADVGDAARTAEAFRNARHVTKISTWIPRVTAVPIEPRAAIAEYDPASGCYTLYAGSGGSHRQRNDLAGVLGVPENRVRVISGDVGGNFGTRNAFYPEFALLAWAARRLARPVKWLCERSDAFLSDYQGRDLQVEAQLALDAEGRFLALRGSNVSNVGAYTVSFVPLTKGVEIMSSVYGIDTAHFRARAVMTHTPPTYPYRSAGRPEAMYVMERLIDTAAREHGFDRVELRRRNLIGDAPYANPLGMTYDGGAYAAVMERALVLGDWAGYAARREQSQRNGRLRGISVSNYIEVTSGAPRERAEITFLPDDKVQLVIGTLSSGQGHETSFSQLVSDWLGVPMQSISMVTGDTGRVSAGGGSHSGRSMRFAGIVVGRATAEIIGKGKRIAAHLLEAPEADMVFADGRFTIKGTDRGAGIFEVAMAALECADLPQDLQGPLAGTGDEIIRFGGFPFGSHVCEVELDPQTGTVDVLAYAAVDDVGRAVNPMILDGQAHGGITQGLGEALIEHCHYDFKTGQLLSGSFMDYAMPRADNTPAFRTAVSESPSPSNPLGVRAGGEGGTTGALAAVANAVADALAGVLPPGRALQQDMPFSCERVWRSAQLCAEPSNE